MLFIFAGLPGTGKSTIARLLARELSAVYLRIDSLEHALVQSGCVAQQAMGPEGYKIAYAVAIDNLRLGLSVVADSVNPLPITRDAWRDVAVRTGKKFVEIELVCSNTCEHQRRIAERQADIADFRLPTWQEVCDREYAPWQGDRLVLDTTKLTSAQALQSILQHVNNPPKVC